MKTRKRIVQLLSIITFLIALILIVQIVSIRKSDAPDYTLQFNNQTIEYTRATQTHKLLGFIDYPIHFVKDGFNTFTTNQIINTFEGPLNACLTIDNPQHETIELCNVSDLEFNQNGLYTLKLHTSQNNVVYEFEFSVNVDHRPSLHLSNLSPSQGGLVLVTLDNLESNSSIEVTNHFTPSAILQENHKAIFYIPIAYRENAEPYPLVISINGVDYTYVLDVQTYSFREVHFTVASSVVSSTVGNDDAVNEYREVIYPTYDSYEPFIYVSNAFQIPVEGARKSSEFGEKRFVNDSKTPTRHAGIDYAVACDTDVVASNAGKIEVAQFLTMIGNTIVIDHGLGLKTYYEHMNDLVVKAGDVVEKGQLIGHVGTTGYSTGCHLHFQAMIKNQSINPEELYTLQVGNE